MPQPAILDGFDHSAYWIRSVARYGCLQIAMVAKGECTAAIAGREYTLREGAVVLIDPHNEMETRRRGRGSRYSGLLCDWTGRRLQPEKPDAPEKNWRPLAGEPAQPAWSRLLGKSIDPILPPAQARRIAPLLTVAVRRWWQGPSGRLRALGHLTEIMVHLLDWTGGPAIRGANQEPADEIGIRAHAWIRDHIHQRPTVDEVAKALGMTRAHFSRRYREPRQSGPGETIRSMILVHLEQDLRAGYSPDDLATRFGWNSTRQLAQFVSRATGTSWRAWLASVHDRV